MLAAVNRLSAGLLRLTMPVTLRLGLEGMAAPNVLAGCTCRSPQLPMAERPPAVIRVPPAPKSGPTVALPVTDAVPKLSTTVPGQVAPSLIVSKPPLMLTVMVAVAVFAALKSTLPEPNTCSAALPLTTPFTNDDAVLNTQSCGEASVI